MTFKLKLSFLVIAGACFCCGAQAENLNSEKAVPHKAEPAGSTGKQVQTAGRTGRNRHCDSRTRPYRTAKSGKAAGSGKKQYQEDPFLQF